VTHRNVSRWGVGLVGTLALLGLGLLFADPVVLTGATIPLAYVLYGAVSGVPSPDLAARRSFDRYHPDPGETVGVTVTVENTGDAVLPDLRVVDGVPDEFAVAEGSPRACVPLGPGETATLTYGVVAKRGEYRFADPAVRLRSLAGSERVTRDLQVEGDRFLSCTNPVESLPVPETSLRRAGPVSSGSGGSGLEFFSTREYQPGDPMNRVDWRHYARTGEFVTVQYRQERATRTVLVVDVRPIGRVTHRQGYPTGAELCTYAAERLHGALDRAGAVSDVTAVGTDDLDLGPGGVAGPDGLPWITDDTTGRGTRATKLFDELRDTVDAGARRVEPSPPTAATDSGPDETTERILTRLPADAQVVVCTPLVDNWPVGFVRSLAGREIPQVVFSPDIAGADNPGQRLAALHRDLRLRVADRAGASAVDWNPEQPVDHALRRSLSHLLSHR
jgi:uncharacterized repeat protein (TIGR01451 family)